jgi:hypothetical protein
MLKFLLSMIPSGPIYAPRVSGQDVLSKTDYFVDVQLWPLLKELDAHRWLSNFTDSELDHAVHLLNGFMYFSSRLLDQLFISAVQSLSASFYSFGDSFLAFQSTWRQFVDSVIVTYVTGEIPNPSDSGYAFARRARQLLGINEDRIMAPDEAVRHLVQQAGPIIFVDDFVGSGNQFVETWRRQVPLSGSTSSFERITAVRGAEFYYCPLACTEYGFDRIRRDCPAVRLHPAHLLSARYSALDPNSIIWPNHLRGTATDFLQAASARAGIPDTNGNVDDWRGFHKLGLAIAMGDSVPDATLPIFYWERNGWIPLIRRK